MNNSITYNKELAIFEYELKSLSNLLQETYEDRGKYLFFNGLLSLLFATIFVLFLTLIISIKMNVPESITILIFMIETIIYISLIVSDKDALKNAKLPIISKKQFLKITA